MRFAFISTMTGYPWGGSEELWSQAALRLLEAGHQVAAATEDNPPLSPRLGALAEKGAVVRVRKIPGGAVRRAVWARLTGRPAREPQGPWLIEQRPDLVVISQGFNTDGCQWMKFCREAGLPHAAIVQWNGENFWIPDRLADGYAADYRGARAVFCVSRHNLRLLEWQLGVDLPQARVVWNPNRAARLELLPWPAESGRIRLACVARLELNAKGQDLLLQTLAQPAWRARAVELNVYGEGSNEKILRALAQRLELRNVNFHGHVADLAEIWRENELLVLPSRNEGMPLALIEAMSCGRPAVVTDAGGNAELCVEGETGFVASAAAVGPLSEALERAWQRRTEWPALGRASRARILQEVPADPVADFCGRLETLAAPAPDPA